MSKPITLANLTRALNKLKDYFVLIKDAVKSVNGNLPDDYGDVYVEEVDFANELTSASTQRASGAFIVRTTGGMSSDKDGDAWLMDIQGRSVKTGYVSESITPEITHAEGSEIEVSINEATFKTVVTESGTTTFTYSSGAWDTDPATYGVTVIGTPVNGDEVEITYVMEDRGTITTGNPSAFVSTGWNLFDSTANCARVAKYDFGYRVDGSFTSLSFSPTYSGTPTAITVTDNCFDIPSDGWVFVTGGDGTTAIYPTWEDWTEGYDGEYETYTTSEISLSTVMSNCFPYGLCSVGNVYDEINLNILTAIRNIERVEYTDENLTTVIASGQAYDTDENYIYYVLATPVTTSILVDGLYQASDHGIEFFEDAEIPVYCQTIYGASLKNKLERDVLTASQQTLTATQKTQVQANLDLNVANNCTTTAAGYVLDARQGKALKDKLDVVGVTNTSSAIGTDSMLVASGSNANIGSISLTPGSYILVFTVEWSSNATGMRTIWVANNNDTTGSLGTGCTSTVAAANGNYTRQQLIVLYNTTVNKTLYLCGNHNSGANLSVNRRLSKARIS